MYRKVFLHVVAEGGYGRQRALAAAHDVLPDLTCSNCCRFFTREGMVAVGVNEEQGLGRYSVTWDGTNEKGHKASAGVYFYRLQTSGQSLTKKMILVR